MAKTKNHLERTIEHYMNIASKTKSAEIKADCEKRIKILKTMNGLKMVGETDAQRHRRVRDGMINDELDVAIKKFRGFER